MNAPTVAEDLAANLARLEQMTRDARADRWRETMAPMARTRAEVAR